MPSAETSPLLRVQALEKCFGGVMALSDYSLEVDDGEIVGIIGANGAGKTTLLRAVSGLLRPRQGRILFESPVVKAGPLLLNGLRSCGL